MPQGPAGGQTLAAEPASCVSMSASSVCSAEQEKSGVATFASVHGSRSRPASSKLDRPGSSSDGPSRRRPVRASRGRSPSGKRTVKDRRREARERVRDRQDPDRSPGSLQVGASRKFRVRSGMKRKQRTLMSPRNTSSIPDEILEKLPATAGAKPSVDSDFLPDGLRKALGDPGPNPETDQHRPGEGAAVNSGNGSGRTTFVTERGMPESMIPPDRRASFDRRVSETVCVLR
jgi:hypothetical protein